MNVLIWSQYFWPENFRINELAVALSQRGLKVTVLTGKPNYPDGDIFGGYQVAGIHRETHAGVEVIRVPLLPRGRRSASRLLLNYLSFIGSGLFFGANALRNRPFDIVFVYAPSPLLQALPAILISRLKRAPLLVWVQDLWPDSLAATGFIKNRTVLGFVKILVRYIYRHSDAILIPSEAFRQSVAKLTDDPGKIWYYPNTAEPIAEQPSLSNGAELVSELKSCFSVVFAGNIGVAQSVETIVDAADQLRTYPHIRFFIVGSGSREAWLREMIAHLNLMNVVLVGRLPYEEMPAVFSCSTALLVTLRDEPALANTIPSKLQAYLSAGKPIVASMNGEGARIVTEAEAGVTSPAEDSQALAHNILKLEALPPHERQRMGANGMRYFKENFDPQRQTDELIRHFQYLVKKNRASKR